jgi:hypothetical protein
MPQLPTIGFLLSLTIESSNLVASRAPYATGVRLNGRRGIAALISVLVWPFTSVQGVLLPSTNAGESMPPNLGSHLGLVQANESSITFRESTWSLA